jgi:hypothetical protein
MLVYTHVTRIGTGKDSDGKGTYKTVETPACSVPVSVDDLKSMLADPYWMELVDVTLNESSKEHKQVVKMPRLAKMVTNSLGLAFNAKARQGEGVEPMKIAAEVLKDGSEADKAVVMMIMTSGDRKRLRAWAEQYLADADAVE